MVSMSEDWHWLEMTLPAEVDEEDVEEMNQQRPVVVSRMAERMVSLEERELKVERMGEGMERDLVPAPRRRPGKRKSRKTMG